MTLTTSEVFIISTTVPAVISSVTALIIALRSQSSAATAKTTANVAKDVAIQALTITNGSGPHPVENDKPV
jgi:hypothetical protein